MNFVNLLIEIELKLKQYKLQFILLLFFWFSGFLYFLIALPGQNLWEIFLYSWTVRRPSNGGDFANFYALAWPILLEVIFFGFIAGELLQKFNPVVTSRILAKHKRNHTLIIGYSHLSERIVDHCIENKKGFAMIEDCEELVEDLINSGYPIIIGDPTEKMNLELASVKKAKEIFITVPDVRIAIICTEKIRKLNANCPIYVRVHEEHVQEYLKQPPLNAFPFSTSQWTMDKINKWLNDQKGNAIVIGRDLMAHRIAYNISLQPGREVYLFDDENDGIEFVENEQLHIINDCACYLSDLRTHLDLKKVSQVFICWARDSEFDEALYLTSKLNLRYPDIKVYVRIFDEELVEMVKKYGAKTFSTSYRAFRLLQNEVSPESAIAPSK